MSGPQARLLSGGRLHLQHGPIDLIIGAEGETRAAFSAAVARFDTVLEELVAELPLLRRPVSASPTGTVARRMYDAVRDHSARFVTPMAAVAGGVADEILRAMLMSTPLDRAYVNNGGDIALHLGSGAKYVTAIQDHAGTELGRITLDHRSGIGGIATSGRHGRSLSMGIADSVTVLARSAAEADVAATLIANAVDLPGHPAIARSPACALDPDSDLGARLVVTGCGSLDVSNVRRAVTAGLERAETMRQDGLIVSAAVSLQDQTDCLGPHLGHTQRSLLHA